MIKLIDKDFKLFSEFKNYCKNDSFGTRIYSHFLCYGYEFDFAQFYVQICDNRVVCSVCNLESDFVVCACDNTDFEELSAFLDFQKKRSVTFDICYEKYINIESKTRCYGDILTYKNSAVSELDFELVTPELKEYHSLLLTCESDDFSVPDYMHFLSDVSRRQMRELCNIKGIYADKTLASCAMTVSYTDFSVILGAVATHPEHRKRGYAGCIVSSLAQEYCSSVPVYIYTTIEKNTRFYEKLGFVLSGRWTKFIMED